MTRPPTATPAQRVCPRCSRIAHTDARRCPFCGGGYRRRPLLWITLLLCVFAAGILAGTAAMLVTAGGRLEDELDTRVTTVQRDLEDQIDGIGDDLEERLDERLRGLSAP